MVRMFCASMNRHQLARLSPEVVPGRHEGSWQIGSDRIRVGLCRMSHPGWFIRDPPADSRLNESNRLRTNPSRSQKDCLSRGDGKTKKNVKSPPLADRNVAKLMGEMITAKSFLISCEVVHEKFLLIIQGQQ